MTSAENAVASRSSKRTKLKLKGTTFMASPVHFRVRTEIAEGDGAFVNFGTVWMERQTTAGGK